MKRETISGLYLIVTNTCDIFTDKRKYYIKVGQSKDLHRRMKSYRSHSPSIEILDFWKLDEKNLDMMESLCHSILEKNKIEVVEETKEWFEVSFEEFFQIYTKHFDYFKGKYFDEKFKKYFIDNNSFML